MRVDHDNTMDRLAKLTNRVRKERSEVHHLKNECIRVNKKWVDMNQDFNKEMRKIYNRQMDEAKPKERKIMPVPVQKQLEMPKVEPQPQL